MLPTKTANANETGGGTVLPLAAAKQEVLRNSTRVDRRVLIIVENLPVPFDRRVWSEATTLAANGYDVSVICPKGRGADKSFEAINGIRIYRHWLPREARGLPGYIAEYCSALFWELVLSIKVSITHGIDVIHACNPPDLIFLVGAFHKYLFGKRFIFDHHDINPELYEAKFGRRDFFWRLMLLLERLTFAVADVSIATNESYKKIALDRGRMEMDNVFVVRSGPNLSRIKLRAPDPKWKNGKSYLVAYVGVIGRQEGLDLLLEAVVRLRDDHHRSDIQFVVVGDGPELEEIRKLAGEMGLSAAITFTGRVDDETLLTILSTADVCVNPDRPNEMNDKSTMNKIMEYMAVGKPIVQFDLTEGRVSAQEASLYARDVEDFADKIVELMDDPVRRSRMGEFGAKRVRDFLTWEHEIPKLLKAYETAFDARDKSAAD